MRSYIRHAARLAVALATFGSPAAVAASGQAAIEALIGNTISYKVEDKQVYTFFAKDGSMKVIMAGQRDDSRWKAIDGKICFEEAGGIYGDCVVIEVTGNSLTMKNEGMVIEAKLLRGNAKHLK